MDERELCADIVRRMISAGASDLHIASGQRIQMRVDGILVPEQCIPDSDTVDVLLEQILSAEQRATLCTRDIDFAWTYAGRRFRVNAYRMQGGAGLADDCGAAGRPCTRMRSDGGRQDDNARCTDRGGQSNTKRARHHAGRSH